MAHHYHFKSTFYHFRIGISFCIEKLTFLSPTNFKALLLESLQVLNNTFDLFQQREQLIHTFMIGNFVKGAIIYVSFNML